VLPNIHLAFIYTFSFLGIHLYLDFISQDWIEEDHLPSFAIAVEITVLLASSFVAKDKDFQDVAGIALAFHLVLVVLAATASEVALAFPGYLAIVVLLAAAA